jgi:hypothetical protein
MHKPNPATINWLLPVCFLLAAIAGLACFVLPPHLAGIRHPYLGLTHFPWFQSAINDLRFIPTACSLCLLGVVLGFVQSRWWWLLGCAPGFFLPIFTTIDMIQWPKTHNLLPFELVIYAMIASPAFIGAFLGFLLKRSLATKQAKADNFWQGYRQDDRLFGDYQGAGSRDHAG